MSGAEVVLVGVGQLRHNRERQIAQAVEPLDLMMRAVGAAVADAGLGSTPAVDLLEVVQIVSWRYDDAAQRLATRLRQPGARTAVSGAGGHQPVAHLNGLARRLSAGEGRVALLAGAEAQASLELFSREGVDALWSRAPGGAATFPREVGGTERMWELGLVAPIRVYPLYENRLRHDLGQTFAQCQAWSGRIYSEFSEVALGNPAAWDPTPRTAEEITTVTDSNRMICWPYPLRMNANNRVDQAAAVLLMTVDAADEYDVPESRRVHVLAGAAAADSEDVLERPGYGVAPGLEHTLDSALCAAHVSVEEVDVLDLYACFPIVPKLAALHLKATDRRLSATGGLSSFGGAHNGYSLHALVAVASALRASGGVGLVYANGEYLTRHAAVILSSASHGAPPAIGAEVSKFPGSSVLAYADEYIGPVEIETWTVEFGRDARPARAWVVARTPGGARTAARVSSSDAVTLRPLTDPDTDPIGLTGRIATRDGRRYFEIGA